MSNYEILVICLYIIGGLYKNPRATIGIYAISNLIFVTIYMQLGLLMAAIAIGLSGLRGLAALFLSDKQNKYSATITTLLIVCLISSEIDHAGDLLLLIAAIAIGTSTFFRDNFIMYRLLSITSNTMWIIHSIVFGVYGMLICASVIVGTGIWVLYKHADFSSIKTELKNTLLKIKDLKAAH